MNRILILQVRPVLPTRKVGELFVLLFKFPKRYEFTLSFLLLSFTTPPSSVSLSLRHIQKDKDKLKKDDDLSVDNSENMKGRERSIETMMAKTKLDEQDRKIEKERKQ
jgi:hypothetical protein